MAEKKLFREIGLAPKKSMNISFFLSIVFPIRFGAGVGNDSSRVSVPVENKNFFSDEP